MVPAAQECLFGLFLPGSVVGDLLSVDRGQEWFLAARVVGDLLSVDRSGSCLAA